MARSPLRRLRPFTPLLLVLICTPLLFLLVAYTLLFHLLPPTQTLVDAFRGRGPRDLFCGQVLRRYRSELAGGGLGSSSSPPPPPPPPAAHALAVERSKASGLRPRDLIERGPVMDFVGGGGGSRIPKLLHQSWMEEGLPSLYGHFKEEWRVALGEGWEWVLWTDADNLFLVETLYPHLLHLYNSFPTEIYRADFSRNLYMHAFGGMYVDLDSSPLTLAPLLNLFDTYTPPPIPYSSTPADSNPFANRAVAFFGEMDTSDVLGGGNSLKGVEHEIPNAWMASARSHPFWLSEGGPVQIAARGMVLGSEGGKGRGWGKSPEWITGPVALRQAYLAYHNLTSVPSHASLSASLSSHPSPSFSQPYPPSLALHAPIILLPPPRIFPYAWTSDTNDLLSCTCSLQTRFFDEGWCKALLKHDLAGKGDAGEGWVVSFWGHSWGGSKLGKLALGLMGGGKARDHVSPFVPRPLR